MEWLEFRFNNRALDNTTQYNIYIYGFEWNYMKIIYRIINHNYTIINDSNQMNTFKVVSTFLWNRKITVLTSYLLNQEKADILQREITDP